MTLRKFASMAHNDDELYDLAKDMPETYEPPDFPSHLSFSMCEADLAEIGAEDASIGASMRFSAMATVTSVHSHITRGSRVELTVDEIAGEDGKFSKPTFPACICLCDGELEKMGLEADADRGDMLHLIGTMRVDAMSSTEWGGDMVTFQITELTFEDESEESREG